MPKMLFKKAAQKAPRPVKNYMDNKERHEERLRELALFALRFIYLTPFPKLEKPQHSLPRRAVKKLLNAVYS
jgi:hypothetical protein